MTYGLDGHQHGSLNIILKQHVGDERWARAVERHFKVHRTHEKSSTRGARGNKLDLEVWRSSSFRLLPDMEYSILIYPSGEYFARDSRLTRFEITPHGYDYVQSRKLKPYYVLRFRYLTSRCVFFFSFVTKEVAQNKPSIELFTTDCSSTTKFFFQQKNLFTKSSLALLCYRKRISNQKFKPQWWKCISFTLQSLQHGQTLLRKILALIFCSSTPRMQASLMQIGFFGLGSIQLCFHCSPWQKMLCIILRLQVLVASVIHFLLAWPHSLRQFILIS